MRVVLIILLLFGQGPAWSTQPELKEFKSDYCTNFPEGTREFPHQWKHCCLIHDLYFWAGGDKGDRKQADLELKSCITQSGSPYIARLMYLAVRAGSYSPVKYPDRKWGNGWHQRPALNKLTSEEIDLLDDEIHSGYEDYSLEHRIYFIHQLRSRLD
jgi:hypothetical protein